MSQTEIRGGPGTRVDDLTVEQAPPGERVTLRTIADRVGVSRMTVSNAFAKPDQLSGALRERILLVAAELGYVGPDPAARALARGATGSVGMLLTDSLGQAFYNAYATAFLAATADALADAGLALTLVTAGRECGSIPARDVAMDGVLVYVCEPRGEDLGWLRRRGLPLVGVDQEPVAGGWNVNIDDRAGARAGAQHLLDLGHRNIAIMTLGTGDAADPLLATTVYAARQRWLGWQDALSAAGVVPQIAFQVTHESGAGYPGARTLLSGPDRPTAVLCFADVLAADVLRAAAELGLDVPGDVSVVGFDDSVVAAQLHLTTVRQDIAAKAAAAVEILTEVIAARRGGTAAEPQHRMIPTELIVRASTQRV